MSELPGLKLTLKRGALVAAANWPLIAVQFVAESTLKVLLAVPVLGGIILVVLLVDADAGELVSGDLRAIVAAVIDALRGNPAALAAFLGAFVLVLLGGSALTFVAKGGTVAILAEAEATAGPIERPPLRLDSLRRAGRTTIDAFLEGCRRLWRRYLQLGACLLLVYAGTGAGYLGFLVGGYALIDDIGVLLGWTVAAAGVSSVLLVWITLINVVYLLTQIVVAVEDVGVRAAVARVFRFGRVRLRELAGIFGVVLALVLLATVASILGTAGLGLLSFVPIVAVIVMPLQIAAWFLRGFAFQYLALTALSAYLSLYRLHRHGARLAAVPGQRPA
ncbi:MAG TPA: hypothetical protein VLD67_14600 [Vicinamibacterales bacterium]|nr:hypothetical protein [Vicinamibacterales bacterium]